MSALVPLDTHEERLRAIAAYPRTLELALEGNRFYWGLLWETHVGFAFWAATPWRWVQ